MKKRTEDINLDDLLEDVPIEIWPFADEPIFYLYEHWRTDKNECFYVGKGYRDRAYNLKYRSKYHMNVQAKLERSGHKVEVRILKSGLTEIVALTLEVRRIAFWRAMGAELVNITAGGAGTAGIIHSEERKRQIGDSKRGNTYRLGAKLSEETKEKIGASHRGKPLSEEHKAVLSVSLSGENNPFFGKKHSAETGRKVAEANRRRQWSDESKAKISRALKGRPGASKGKTWTLSAETKQRMSEAAKRSWRTPSELISNLTLEDLE